MKVSLRERNGNAFFSESFVNQIANVTFCVFNWKNINALKENFKQQRAIAKVNKAHKWIFVVLFILQYIIMIYRTLH